MYREKKFIHCQYYVSADWTGGIFASPTLAGSRSGRKFDFLNILLGNDEDRITADQIEP